MRGFYQEPATFIVESNIRHLQNRLRRGQVIEGRIVLVLSKNTYLLRLFGYNLVMQSKHVFERFEEVEVVVRKVRPKLELSLGHNNETGSSLPEVWRGTDIVI
jgi:hypothetical protein